MTPYWAYPPAYTPQEERRFLELQKEELRDELRAVEERLKELEKTEKQTA
jgi:flagellar motility protein MotE (MotC chaperone)